MDTESDPRPDRLRLLRAELTRLEIDAFLIPIADPHQGFPLAVRDRRLEWLTGFSGTAGTGAAGRSAAALFVDGRYAIQARMQAGTDDFEIRDSGISRIKEWAESRIPHGSRIGIDPWLHTDQDAEKLKSALTDWTIVCVDNPIDKIWKNRPSPPQSPMFPHDVSYAGQSREDKIKELSRFLTKGNFDSAVFTSSESIAWLLNLRGSDIDRNPVKHAFAVVKRQGDVTLCVNLPDGGREDYSWLGSRVSLRPLDEFEQVVEGLSGRVFAADTATHWLVRKLSGTGVELCRGTDPCALPKAQKNSVQINGFVQSHLRDGAAMAEFLAWLNEKAVAETVTELEAAEKLLEFRRRCGCLHDISFDTISAAGPNAAIVHYSVTPESSRALRNGDLYLTDSGGQYRDGTTDVTRSVPIGTVSPAHIRTYTLILRGLIALSTARWPANSTGRDLDVIARQYLWREQLDYAHGTGHGVGHFLSVHEGPANISRKSDAPLREGMVLSIEPGCYFRDDYGIRLENLAAVRECDFRRAGQEQRFLEFQTLTMVPFDRRMISASLLSNEDIAWLDRYHSRVLSALRGQCSETAGEWLESACAPLR